MKEPHWLDLRDVRALHEQMLARFGGAEGVRDTGLLESALARPRWRFRADPSADLCDIAASLAGGILRNHPFVDGNKRTGFLSAILFLELHGARFHASEEAAARAVLAFAAGAMTEPGFAAFLRDFCILPENGM